MYHSKILTGFFLGVFFLANAQNSTTQKKLLATAERPGVITTKAGPNTVLYRYAANTPLANPKNQKSKVLKEDKIEAYTYPKMRAQQGAILPFEIIFNGEIKAEEGILAQEIYYKNLTTKPEKNKIIYQDIETTKERLHAAGIYDANDLHSFDMPLIAKIVGAGVLITATVKVDTKDSFSKKTEVTLKEYKTNVVLKIFNRKGMVTFSNTHAPYAATTANSYQTTLDFVMKQTPYYFKN